MAFSIVQVQGGQLALVDADGNVIQIIDDAGVKKLAVAARLHDGSAFYKATTPSDTQPVSATALPLPAGAATETTLAAIKAKTDNLPSDPAREGGHLATLDTVLTAIRDTAGIKKITDQLPAGTNEIGKVAQGTKAVASAAWPFYMVDGSGNVIGVVLDGSIYRFQTEAQLQTKAKGTTPAGSPTSVAIDANTQAQHVTIRGNSQGVPDCDVRIIDASGHVVGLVLDDTIYRFQTDGKIAKETTGGALVHLDAVPTVTGRGRLKATLYTADGDPIAFPSSSRSIKNEFVKNGGSDSLLVNGSVTPQVFEYLADDTYDISLQEIKFTVVANGITFGSNYFGSTAGPLTNGLLIEVVTGGSTVTLYNLLTNESFVNFASPGGFEWVVSSKDLMSSGYLIGGGLKLVHGAIDKVKVTVRDNLSAAGVYLKCYVKGNLLGA